jgi:iron complex outermembrane receptor protein
MKTASIHPAAGRRGLAAAVAAALAAVAPATVLAEDLGLITVESTTIDDRFEAKREEPSNIAVISGEEVDKAHAENIHQMLQSVPGITTEFDSGEQLKIHIRGVENQRYMGEKPGVAVVIDGVPVFERTGRVNIDLDNIESIKVVKGGASYLFGDDALSGAVIITTKRGAKQAGYTAGVEAGSFGFRKYLGRAGFAGEKASGHVQVSRRQTDGYYKDSDSQSDYLNGKLQYYIDDVSDLTFGFERSERAKDSHGTVDGITAAKLDPKSEWIENDDYTRMYDVDLAKYFVTYSRDWSDTGNLLLNAYQFSDDTAFVSKPINGYYYEDGTLITDPNAYATATDYHQVQRGIKAELRQAGEKLAWLAALDLRANTYEQLNENITTYKYSRFSSRPAAVAGVVNEDGESEENIQAAYGELKFRVTDPLVVTLNGRYDHIALDYSDNLTDLELSRDFNVTSWRLGGNYALNDTTDIYANASTGFRAPSVEQLFAGSTNPDGNVENNPDLDPEQALNLELGLRRTFSAFGINWDLDTAIFQIDREDYIMSSAGQYGVVDLDGEPLRYENIGGMRSRGLELVLRSDSAKPFWVNISYSFLDAFFTQYDNFNLLLGNRYGRNGSFDPATGGNADGVCDPGEYDTENQYCLESYDLEGNDVPRAPAHHLNVGLNWRAAPYLTLTGEIDASSSYYADELNWNEVDGHAVFNLLATYERSFGENQTWNVFARVDNLFDADYWNTARGSSDGASPGTGGVPDGIFDMEDISIVVNPGRTYTVGVSARF